MEFRARTVLMTVFLAVWVAGSAEAGKIFIQVHGGVSSFNLDDVNDTIDRFNAAAGGQYLANVNSGWDAGLHLGYELNPGLGLGLGYARLGASSGFSADGYLVEYDLPAELYEISLDYLPASDHRVRFGAGVTLGLIRSDASLLVTEAGENESLLDFDGTGFHFAGYAICEAPFSANWSAFGQGGFRHAIIGELKVDGEVVLNPDSLDDKLRFNYSGLFLRIGVKFRP
jgi:hypothetical protein